ncbi:hypothetical protein SPRG_00772 [Saprolegnia parasitica CBS 223.65]|uniref:Uncharacterized protein n=1 Tax=Saprolegnia parasitica (strain CBS 223.65) TaxID=695850 RepID=A0A067CVL2_SAPPC|nr:hypothetical protein SPRG_00772 [Saprolegnia parasitica CBS 223.65]KDO34709.1 hypothetical protein SPRG_00772 [Saprolegnia parasitica CBS 223.65]|eukprot:XP_012194379.1 hypothetical protein SPRG_00772 [Saprolegnia parasitica CBS 223.65]
MLGRASARLMKAPLRHFSTELAPVAEKKAAPVAPKKAGSSLLQRLTAFCVGAGLAGAGAVYQIRQDLKLSNAEIQKEIGALKNDVVESNARLAKRVAQLEKTN